MCQDSDAKTQPVEDTQTADEKTTTTPPVKKTHTPEEILQWEGGGCGDNCGSIGVAPQYRNRGR